MWSLKQQLLLSHFYCPFLLGYSTYLHRVFLSGLYIIYTRPYIYEVELSISYIEWRLCSEGQLARPWAFAARMAVTFIEQYKQCRALRIESEFCCRLDGPAAAARSGVQASACAPHHKPYFLIKFLYGCDFVMLEVCSRRCAAPLARPPARPPSTTGSFTLSSGNNLGNGEEDEDELGEGFGRGGAFLSTTGSFTLSSGNNLGNEEEDEDEF